MAAPSAAQVQGVGTRVIRAALAGHEVKSVEEEDNLTANRGKRTPESYTDKPRKILFQTRRNTSCTEEVSCMDP